MLRVCCSGFVLLWLAFLSGCGGSAEPEPQPAVPDGAEIGVLHHVEACTHAEHAAECSWLVVPENHSDSSSRLIYLPIKRILTTGPDVLEPIYHLDGGPGQSNLGFSRVTGLIEQHDIVLVGYRGVDGTVRLDCPEVDALFTDLPGPLLGRETWAATAEAYGQCATRLDGEGVDLSGYAMNQTIEDLEWARRALGHDRVNTLSQSYGTRLAMYWAWLYPASIHRSVLISVNPPGHFVWEPAVVDQQLEQYAELCAADEHCSGRTEDLAEAMRRVSGDMPKRWLFLPIKEDNVRFGTFMLLYHTTSAPTAIDAWLTADAGDPSSLAVMSLMIDVMLSQIPMVWGESVAKATSADYELVEGTDYVASYMPEDSIIGAPASPVGFAGAKGWPRTWVDDTLRSVQSSDAEMLLVSGSIDFSTPAEAATQELLPSLANGQQVILRDFGHTEDVWDLQPEATRHLLTTYFATGEVDDSKFVPHVVQFDAGLGFGAIAKLILAGFAAILAAVCLTVFWLIRRRRRRAQRGVRPG